MKSISRKLLALAALAIAVVLAFPPAVAEAAKIKLSKKSVTVYVGSAKTLKLKGAKKADVKWSTSDKKIATVTSAGKVKGVKKGTATITATYKGKEYTCKVKVKKPSLNYTKADMNPGETLDLVLTGTTAKKWKSSNKKVATVSKGKVTAVAAGTATITVTGKDRKKYKLKVTVTDIPEAEDPEVSLDLSTVFYDGKLSGTGSIPNSALSASIHGVGPKDADFGRAIPDSVRENLWGGDMTVMRFRAVQILDDSKEFPAEDGYFWAKAVLICELVDSQTQVQDGREALVITEKDLKNAKFDEGVTLRYTGDALRSPLDGVKAGKDGYYTFTLTVGGREYKDCRFRTAVEKDERTWYISRYTVAYMKLPVAASTELFLTTSSLDGKLKDNTSREGVTSYGAWSPYTFSPIVCNLRVLTMYGEETGKDTYIPKFDKEMCRILGIEFTGEEHVRD